MCVEESKVMMFMAAVELILTMTVMASMSSVGSMFATGSVHVWQGERQSFPVPHHCPGSA